jgi:hypothetical protein
MFLTVCGIMFLTVDYVHDILIRFVRYYVPDSGRCYFSDSFKFYVPDIGKCYAHGSERFYGLSVGNAMFLTWEMLWLLQYEMLQYVHD